MSTGEDGMSVAVRRAETGAGAWRAVVHAQQAVEPDHRDWYALAGELVATLRALEALGWLLARQADRYVERPGLYDDTRQVDPAERLAGAAEAAAGLARALAEGERLANRFWSEIGHIGLAVALDQDHAGEVGR